MRERPRFAVLERWPLFLLGAVCYVPLLFTAPGQVGADTKTYLYQDPGRLLSRAAYMWNSNVHLGTVTHQNIGYLFPMGPYYWLAERVGMPMWLAQRIWLGSILFFAGAGVWFLLRTLRWSPLPCMIAAFAYALTPYTLTLEARLSGILLPFSGLPWLIALTIRAIRRGGWRDPALFALVVLVIGQTNATGLIYAVVGPLLWFPFAVWVTKEAPLRRATGAYARIGGLSLLTSLWWIIGYAIQGSHGLDVLSYTEAAPVVASAAVAPEILRGLGYWFFYGGDRLGPWIEPSVDYTQRLWLIAVTYTTPVLAFLGAAVGRWKHRAYFVTLAAVGLFIAVGAHPWDDPPLTGSWWKALLETDRGLALRSTPRAIPLIALGLAALLALGFQALVRVANRVSVLAALGVVALIVAGLPPLFTNSMVAANLQRPEDIPQYWLDAIAALDAEPHDTRVLELPGIDFSAYRWGNTVDPITPGLMDRPYVARELVPYGSGPSSNLLIALDERMQENTLEPRAVAPIARLMGVGQIVARNDLQFERYRVARPYEVMPLLSRAPDLSAPTTFGTPVPVRTSPVAMTDDEAMLRDDAGTAYAPVAVFTVQGRQPIVRAITAQHPLLVAGDGDGLVNLAAAGLIDGRELIQYSAAMTNDRDRVGELLDRGAVVVVTDTNRRRGLRWSTLRDNHGYTEQAGERALRDDPTDSGLPVFPDAGDDAYTVTQYPGGVSARATSYGNPTTFTPEHRPANAVDGDLRTVWRTGTSQDVRGETLELTFAEPVETDHIRLTQVLTPLQNRSITALDLRFDHGNTERVELGPESNTVAGQTVTFPRQKFTTLELIVRAEDATSDPGFLGHVRYTGLSAVGFSEVDVDGRRGNEIVRLPTDLLAATGDASTVVPLTIVLERQRIDAAESKRDDEELALARTWSQPSTRTFLLGGAARVSPRTDDETADLLLGVIGPTATSSRRIPGDLRTRASAAIDGNASTAWTPGFGDAGDDSMSFQLGRPATLSHLDLMIVADGRHSVPTHMSLEVDGRRTTGFTIPAITDRPGTRGAAAALRVPIDLPDPVTGSQFTFVIDGVREVLTKDWFGNTPTRMPVGIAELGAPELSAAAATGQFDSGCRSDLLTVDDRAVSIEITGSVSDATTSQPLAVKLCGSDAAGLVLPQGDHVLRAAKGIDSGLDLDRLVLQSAAGGSAPASVQPLATGSRSAPTVRVDGAGQSSFDLTIEGATPGQPFWLALGQSNSSGWRATVDGRDLGRSELVQGFANGWLITPAESTMSVELRWTPQQRVWIGLALSAVGVLVCLVLAIRRPRDVALTVDDPVPEQSYWVTFLRSRGRDEPSTGTAVAVMVVSGLIAAAVIGPAAGAITGVVAGVAARRRRARWWLALGAPGLLAASGAYVIARQARAKPAPAFEWPAEQSSMHQIALMSMAFLVLLVVVDALWDRVNRRSRAVADAAASAPTEDASPTAAAPDSPA